MEAATSVSERPSAGLGVQDRHGPLRDGPPGGPGVVAGGELTQRQEEFRDDDQDGERPVELDLTRHQAEADLDGNEGNGDRTTPLENERGLECGPEDFHRRIAVAPADRPDVVDLLLAPAEHLEGRHALEHVEEEGAQPADLGESPLGDRPGPPADHREQQDQDRTGDDEDEGRRRIDEQDRHEHEQRDGDRE